MANGIPLATQTHLPLHDTRILTWWWPPEAEPCRLIIKIPYISCNKLFSNSCLVFNLNYYKFVVLDVHSLLFSILISTTGMIHLDNETVGTRTYFKHRFDFTLHNYLTFNYSLKFGNRWWIMIGKTCVHILRSAVLLRFLTFISASKPSNFLICIIILILIVSILFYFFLLALQPPLGVVFYSPLAGFSLLAYEVSWSHTTTRHSR